MLATQQLFQSLNLTLRGHDNTWFYSDFSLVAPTSGTNIVNKATGTSAISDVIPMAGGVLTAAVGSTVLQFSTDTELAFTNFSAADPFSPSTHGLTMGCLFKKAAQNSKGLIHYGGVNADEHFFARIDSYGPADSISIGEDTGAADTWTTAATGVSDDTWYFFVITISSSGTMTSSLNGSALNTIRTDGTAPTPADAHFGIQGSSYNDNDGQNDYAQFFFYKGVITDAQITKEYDYLKSVFTGASLP